MAAPTPTTSAKAPSSGRKSKVAPNKRVKDAATTLTMPDGSGSGSNLGARDRLDNLADQVESLSQSASYLPEMRIANAARTVALRRSLVDQSALDIPSLAKGRGTSIGAARKLIARALDRNQLLSVRFDDNVLVPLFCFDEAFDLRLELQPLIEMLAQAGEQGWSAWTYLGTESGWLDGAVPVEVYQTDPEFVLEATRRRLGLSS